MWGDKEVLQGQEMKLLLQLQQQQQGKARLRQQLLEAQNALLQVQGGGDDDCHHNSTS